MLISFKKGIIHSFDLNHLIQFTSLYSGLWTLGLQVKVQTSGNRNYNELKAIKDISENTQKFKDYFKTTISSFGTCISGIIFNNCVIWGINLISRDHHIANRIKNIIFEISYPTIKYLSCVLFLLPNNNDSNQKSLTSVLSPIKSLVHAIKNRPKPFITSLVYYISINQIRYHFVLYINLKMIDYYMNNYLDQSASKPKDLLLSSLYLMLSNPIVSSVTLSILITPFQNLSNQYFKLLTESKSNQFSFIESNPFAIYRELIHKKGIVKSLFSGVSLTFLMGILKLGI